MALDLFKEMNNAILDLQASDIQTFEWPLQKLSELLKHEELKEYNAKLTQDLNLENLLGESEKTGGSFVGSARLLLPNDYQKRLGYIILIIQWLGKNPKEAINFCHRYFYSGSKLISGIHTFTKQILIPFARDYENFVCSGEEIMLSKELPLSNKIFIVHGHNNEMKESVARYCRKTWVSSGHSP